MVLYCHFQNVSKPLLYLRSCATLQQGLEQLALQRVHEVPEPKDSQTPMPTASQTPTASQVPTASQMPMDSQVPMASQTPMDSQMPMDSQAEAETLSQTTTLPWLGFKNKSGCYQEHFSLVPDVFGTSGTRFINMFLARRKYTGLCLNCKLLSVVCP